MHKAFQRPAKLAKIGAGAGVGLERRGRTKKRRKAGTEADRGEEEDYQERPVGRSLIKGSSLQREAGRLKGAMDVGLTGYSKRRGEFYHGNAGRTREFCGRDWEKVPARRGRLHAVQ